MDIEELDFGYFLKTFLHPGVNENILLHQLLLRGGSGEGCLMSWVCWKCDYI